MKDSIYLIMNRNGVKGTRKTRPNLAAGEVAVLLRVEVDNEYFNRAIPAVDLHVPADHLIEPNITVALEQEETPDKETLIEATES